MATRDSPWCSPHRDPGGGEGRSGGDGRVHNDAQSFDVESQNAKLGILSICVFPVVNCIKTVYSMPVFRLYHINMFI